MSTYSRNLLVITGIAVLLAAGITAADQRSQTGQTYQEHHRNGDDHQVMADHVSARAALEPIGTVAGWGHAMVRDQISTEGDLRRMVVFRVVGLEAEAEYTATVTGVDALDDRRVHRRVSHHRHQRRWGAPARLAGR